MVFSSILIRQDNFDIQETFIFLSLMGLCFNPLKNYQKIGVNIHQGLNSLNRLQVFFNLPENNTQ